MFAPLTHKDMRGRPRYMTPNGTATPIHSSFPDLTQPPLSVEHSEFGASPSPSSAHEFQTPSFRRYDQRSSTPLSLEDGDHASPHQMPSYPNTPSPPGSYGIAGGLIVSEPGIMQSATSTNNTTNAGCQPLLPSQADPFISSSLSKTHRPILRPSFSHNSVLNTPSPGSWPRRFMTDDPSITGSRSAGNGERERERARSSTAVHHFVAPEIPAQVPISHHEATTPFAVHSGPVSTLYSDELPFHTTSTTNPYPHSYDSFDQHHHLPFYPLGAMPPVQYRTSDHRQKQDEPVLGHGEMPAPRPPMSYAALIGEALLLSPPPHSLYVSEISDSIQRRYTYYRQNPSKVYNGVRHQTSMCRAFVKLPRPFGDQSGGARKWAIRAGCETWFSGGGYHPPGSLPVPAQPKAKAGKAKTTARAKQLAIGTDSTSPKTAITSGPSSGPAYDGSSSTHPQPQSQPAFNNHPHYLSPGYHYVPVLPPHAHNYSQPGQPVFVPFWGPYGPHDGSPVGYPRQQVQAYASSPEQWREQEQVQMQGYEERPETQGSGSESLPEEIVTARGSTGSSQGPSPKRH